MNSTLAAAICTVLATMPGYPSWHGETGEVLDERFMTALLPVPDATGKRILAEVDRHFSERPAVKSLLDWAQTIAPARTFEVPALPSPRPERLRLTHGLNDERPPMPEYGAAIVRAAGAPPPVVREVLERLRARQGEAKAEMCYGLQFRNRASGNVSRTHASMTEAAAHAAAAERNAKWPHQETTVFRKDDPAPTRADAQAAQMADDAQAEDQRPARRVVRRRETADA